MMLRTLLLLLCLVPGTAFAQTLASSQFPTDHPLVYVVDFAGQETAGLLERADTSSVTIRTLDAEKSFALPDVYEVYRRGDSVWSGTVIGAVSGGVVGALLLADAPCGALLTPRPCTFRETVGILGFTSGIGAGIGLGIDALIRGRTRIYPFVSRRGVSVSVFADW
jgi:hypothetical protein